MTAPKLAIVAFLEELVGKRWWLRRVVDAKLLQRPVTLAVYTQDSPDVAEKALRAACRATQTTMEALAKEVVFIDPGSDADVELRGNAVAIFALYAQQGPLARLPRFRSGRVLGKYVTALNNADRRSFPPRPPDFVGVGVQKAGTTWWTKVLREHPKVIMPMKELHFFDGLSSTSVEDCPSDLYARFFRRRPDVLSGEFTPSYVFWDWVPQLLSAAAPSAKIIVMLRDPVERFRSGLAELVQLGLKITDESRERNKRRGFYAEQLERLFQHFDKENVLVLQYEKCTRDALHYYRETLRFIGARNVEFVPPSLNRQVHKTRVQKDELDPAERKELADAYRDDMTRVAELVPDIDLSLWQSFR